MHTDTSDTESVVTNNKQDFKTFIQKLAVADETWKFWIQFVFQDVAAYIGLFLASRRGDWYLRTACIKWMAPAFDHEHYYKMITPSRFALYATIHPHNISAGAFLVSIRGRTCILLK